MKGKRGISDVITTVLIILLALAAIVIVWQAIKKIVSEESGGISDISILTVQLTIEKNSVYLNYTVDNMQFTVSRGADKADVASIKIVVLGQDLNGETKSHTEVREKNIPAPLGAATYVVNVSGFKEDSITKLTVYPISPKGRVGSASSYIIKPDDIRSPGGGSWAADDEKGYTGGGDGGDGGEIPEENPCEGVPCDNIIGALYCLGDNVYKNITAVSCVDGSCVSGATTPTLDEDCPRNCSSGACVECNSNLECTNPEKPICQNHVCVMQTTTLSSCQTLSTPGVYVLNNNIQSPSPGGNCIIISNNNITIDGNWRTITGYNKVGAGIYVGNKRNINITNLKIINFDYGISFSEVNNSYISNVNSSYNEIHGIYLQLSSQNNLKNNTLTFNTYNGIYLDTYSQNNYLTGNTIKNNWFDGIALSWYSNNNNIEKNFVCNNNQSGTSPYKDLRCATSSGNYGAGNTFGWVTACTDGWPSAYNPCP